MSFLFTKLSNLKNFILNKNPYEKIEEQDFEAENIKNKMNHFMNNYLKKNNSLIQKNKNKNTKYVRKINKRGLGKINIIINNNKIKFTFFYFLNLTAEFKKLDKEDECPVCYTNCEYKLKKCGHTLCKKCCKKILDNSTDKFNLKCPYCRKEINLKYYEIEKIIV